MKFATQMFNISHHTLPMFVHYLGNFKSSNLLHIRNNANKVHLFYMPLGRPPIAKNFHTPNEYLTLPKCM